MFPNWKRNQQTPRATCTSNDPPRTCSCGYWFILKILFMVTGKAANFMTLSLLITLYDNQSIFWKRLVDDCSNVDSICMWTNRQIFPRRHGRFCVCCCPICWPVIFVSFPVRILIAFSFGSSGVCMDLNVKIGTWNHMPLFWNWTWLID